jgi:arabinose-5-phosphate isomerase
LGVPFVAMAGRRDSTLARAADVFLDIAVDQEACPLGLAPTSSTAATLAMGDALAVAMLEARGFREEDFAMLHPGGKLGRRWLRVTELMHTGDRLPKVAEDALLKDVIYEISSKGLGMTVVLDARGGLGGIVTDGDLRRMFGSGIDFYGTPVGQVMTRNPKTVAQDALAEQALRLMEEHSITSLVVTAEEGAEPVGVIHLHDLLKAGVV